MHVLIVHDGSSRADAAARFVLLLPPSLAVRITVVGASATLRPGPRANRAATRVAAALRAHGLQATVTAVEGATASSIASSILDRSGDPVDLVVVGSGRSALLPSVTGDTARTLLRRSTVPVIVVGDAPVALRHLLVCTSLHLPHSAAALEPAIRIAEATGADVDVLHVMSQLPRGGGSTDIAGQEHGASWHREHRTAEGRHIDEVLTLFTSRGVATRARIRHGLVVDEIIAHARQRPADLVVLGAHDRAGHPTWLLENITEKVVDELARPVLVVREPPAGAT